MNTYIETVRVVDSIVCNWQYHKERARRTTGIVLPNIYVPDEYSLGLFKCRIVYCDKVISIEYIPYKLPIIKRLYAVNIPKLFYQYKYSDRSEIESYKKGIDLDSDIIMVHNGLITDTSFCNIVIERGGELFTPKTPLLCGTMRAYLLDNNHIKEEDIKISDIYMYDKIYMINALNPLGRISLDISHETIIL